MEYGFINTCLKSLVIDRFGEETWDKLRDAAGVQDTFMTYEVYKDDITMRLVTEACKMLDLEQSVVLRQFGEYFFEFCKRAGYDHMLRTLGGNLFEFMENLDALHGYLSLSYKEMNAPSFRVERNNDGTMLLHYYSDRRGLCHIVPGIIGAVAKDFFNSKVKMEIVNQIEEVERTGKKEHIVFLITQSPVFTDVENVFPQTLHNQTKVYRHNTIYKEETERSLQRKFQTHDKQKNHWGRVKSLVHPEKGKTLWGFQPVYPDHLCVDLKTFCNAFPFHIVFDEQLRVRQAGVTIQRIVPGLQTMCTLLDQYFTIQHPQVTFNISSIRKFINSHFVLRTQRDMMPVTWRERPMLELRGQMLWMPPLRYMLYLASPLLRSLQELEERHLYLSDIAPHDATRDLILLNQQRLAEMELSNQLERKKEELRHLSKHLEEEKQKTENLLYAMLPKHVANRLKEGKRVEAGEFKECTILFSDVVTFTNICSECEPIQIVSMLNSMYLKFDRLTTVHNVYKVETIGDAYMVVGGVPIPVSSHTERVANFALGMIIAAKEVTNPVTDGPIQIRVGLHSGPVLAGVVGEKMPRYCLFGDTVNTASRMESHGLPDKIHLSPSVYQALRDKGYEIEERGEIEVKGKGRMQTYFLQRNLKTTESEIMGLLVLKADSGRESAHSTRDCASDLPRYRPTLQASQRLQRGDRCPIVPMKYGDSLIDSKPPAKFIDPRHGSITGKPRDSERYGSLYSGNRSLDEPFELMKKDAPNKPKERKRSIAKHNRHVRTRFCLLL
ncbi:guanylate cyclase soluble subunit beta-2-like [Myxocyprinus asiaticus]|uniref:guanylate cyclase soluble subunit beta-2-like n=1 Tax=Myxocyprinus asiaticus TaxID=70543 RepID=UPI0022227E06|nr:guanylate cyclase soluble subunit beta-2-like [Myxocyprinus asiaticus]